MLHGSIFSPPATLDELSYPADHRYILDQGPLPHVPSLPGLINPSSLDYQQLVLEQTALIFNNQQSLAADLDPDAQQYPYLSTQQYREPSDHLHFHKRPRLNAAIQMPRPCSDDLLAQDGREKAALGGQSDGGVSSSRKACLPFTGGGLSGWTSARISDWFASISMCPPFESQPCKFLALHVLPPREGSSGEC